MKNSELIRNFYQSFTDGNAKGMIACYHKDVTFQDPVFGRLEGEEALKMWEMLLSRRSDSTKMSFDNVETTIDGGTASWTAEYVYGEKKRNVINKVSARFVIKNGKIIEHIDSFDLWKWTQQAMGPVGYLLGWTPFMKAKIQKTTKQQLDAFIG